MRRLSRRHSYLLRIILICTITAASPFTHANASDATSTQVPSTALTPTQETEAKEMYQSLHCMVCSGQSLSDSDAELAIDMRNLIRSKLASGETKESIYAFLTSRYGESILMQPPFNPLNAALWLAPLVMMLAGGIWIMRSLFRSRPAHTCATTPSASDDTL
jgi:cytochrome c-type biogenesis protein CcmH